MDVAAAQVERPCDVVERCHQHSVGMLLPQGTAYALQLLVGRLPGLFQRLPDDGILRYGRPVVPHLAQRIEVRAERDAALTAQVVDELSDHGRAAHHAVDRHFGALHVAQLCS